MIWNAIHMTYKMARRIVVFVVGTSVVLVGIALIVLPGPAFIVIPVGLAILSIEIAWARMWLKRVRESISRNAQKLRERRAEEQRRDRET